MLKINNLYKAQVIENDDSIHPIFPGKESRVKIYIESFMEGWEVDHYPWAYPFNLATGASTSSGKVSIPEKNSYIWVFFGNDEFKKDPYYIADYVIPSTSIATKYETSIKSQVKGKEISAPTSSYPDVKFTHFKNGINIAVSSSSASPEVSVFHPAGSTIFIDKNGKILIKSASTVNIESGNDTLEFMAKGETLKAKLEELIDAILNITVTTPSGPSTLPLLNAVTFQNIKSALGDILSPNNKNN